MRRDPEAVAGLREQGVALLGADGFVRAIGVAAGFDGINRVADAIGIPLDDRFSALDDSFWDATHINEFSEDGVIRIKS